MDWSQKSALKEGEFVVFKDFLWNTFEKTGTVDIYLSFKEFENGDLEEEKFKEEIDKSVVKFSK
jgi:hypothetical protein